MSPILACPICSTPPLISRPECVRGVRSGVYFMVGGMCPHINTWGAANTNADPEPLIARWNEWATKQAALRSAAAGHSPERAAAFLAALHEVRYSK